MASLLLFSVGGCFYQIRKSPSAKFTTVPEVPSAYTSVSPYPLASPGEASAPPAGISPYPVLQPTRVVEGTGEIPDLPKTGRPFFDCKMYPGITNCTPLPSIPLHGLISIRDRWTNIVYTIDLETGSVDISTQTDSQEVAQVAFQALISQKGTKAWLENKDYTWTLHVQNGTLENATTWELEPQPTDRIYTLIDWVPNTPILLLAYLYGSNDSMFYGGYLNKFNTQSGEKANLPGRLVIANSLSSEYEWHPNRIGVLAFTDEGLTPAILNVLTGEKTVITPDAVRGASPTWSPDGKRIAFSAAS